VLVLVRGGLAARKTTIPFGPFLALGALIVLFGPHLSDLAS
jgi:prepilin signal peptidase PulO-like enzyme (type II secretory pathway)